MTEKKSFLLTSEQDEYLSELASGDDDFADALRRLPTFRKAARTVECTGEDAERLRDYFTRRLATVGFDAQYRPNKEGMMLESLIDAFFSP